MCTLYDTCAFEVCDIMCKREDSMEYQYMYVGREWWIEYWMLPWFYCRSCLFMDNY